jgi:uncharacterized protein
MLSILPDGARSAYSSGRRAARQLSTPPLDATVKLYTVYLVEIPGGVDRSRLLARDYWLILSTPLDGTDRAAIEAQVDEHLAWLLTLEQSGVLLMSGPLLSGPGVRPGSGVTVLRAVDEDAARAIAAEDPFVRAGLRTFAVHHWRINEGSVGIRVSLGTGTYEWD